MAIDTRDVLSAVTSKLSALGVFDRVEPGEPITAPAGRLCSVMLGNGRAAPGISGLGTLSMRFEVIARFYLPLSGSVKLAEVEQQLFKIIADVVETFVGDFSLRDTYPLDLQGAHGDPIVTTSGYVQLGDTWYRTGAVTLPLIVIDAFDVAE